MQIDPPPQDADDSGPDPDARAPTALPRPGREGEEAPVRGLVLDTNAALDWLWFADPGMDAPARAIATGRCTWWITPSMQAEFTHVLTTRLAPRDGRDPAPALQACRRWARERQPPPGPSNRRLVCRDPDDQMFVDLAVATGARWLLTRDRALLALARHARPFGLEITPPQRWSAPDP